MANLSRGVGGQSRNRPSFLGQPSKQIEHGISRKYENIPVKPTFFSTLWKH